MKLEQSFEVKAPVETVWETLIDVERVAPCLPGADITDAKEDGSYEGTFQVKLGPTTAAYTGKLSMDSLDEDARRATMKASGRDKRGQGSANATIVSTMHQSGETTRVDVETDFTITGRLARFGRGGMIQDISNRLLKDFANCLQRNLEAGGEAAGAGADQQAPPAGGDAGAGTDTGGGTDAERTPSPTAGTPPTASPGPSPAATGGAGGAPPGPAAEPSGTPGGGPGAGAAEGGGAAGAKPPAPARPRPAAQPAKPVQGFSLFFSVLLERIKRFFARLRSR